MGLQQTLEVSVKTLIEELSKDKKEGSYYHSWQANIAMAFQDEFGRFMGQYGRNEAVENIHLIANNASKNFLDLLTRNLNEQD